MDSAEIDDYMNRGFMWLPDGASLLRSAFVLLRQNDDDKPALFEPLAPGGHRPARVVYPAIMLAAMAVECALNAVIAESKGVNHGGTLNFPWGSHDLKALAEGAGIKPADA
jgi:hypothetical protein